MGLLREAEHPRCSALEGEKNAGFEEAPERHRHEHHHDRACSCGGDAERAGAGGEAGFASGEEAVEEVEEDVILPRAAGGDDAHRALAAESPDGAEHIGRE